MATSETPAWARAVNAFWFEDHARSDWFAKSDAFDEAIRSRFMADYERLASGLPDAVTRHAHAALAAVIILDQMPRNMFRGNAQAFATDALAREVAHRAVDRGQDAGLTVDQRLFLYLPFEHSEDLADQERAVALISALGDDEYTRYAIAHREVIARFGRFPHRNAALGRASTTEEVVFLRQPGSAF